MIVSARTFIDSQSIDGLPSAKPNTYYPSNRSPLTVSPLVKLPIGSIEPRGWLLSQLRLVREGFSGRLAEISPFLKADSGWISPKGKGWEEMPYWLRGYGDLGFLLKDSLIRKEAEYWLNSIHKSQQPDGYFGPLENKEKNDLWPNMIVLNALQNHYEATGDRRILSFISRYFQYQFHLPPERLLPEGWQKFRGGENLESVYWLYNRTGEKYLLDFSQRLFQRTANWTSPILTEERDEHWEESSFYHGVNIAMGFRQPAVYYQQSKDIKLLEAAEANYTDIMKTYGQQPGGMFCADENILPGNTDPRQGAETCSMIEFIASFLSLLRITGNPVWADRCEEIVFNSLPATMTPDLRGAHFLTAPNLISCDSTAEHAFQNSGTLVSFDPWNYRCCQHNVISGWPSFAEHLWMATADNGLAAMLYAPSFVRAVLHESANVMIAETTDYPFGDSVNLTVSVDRPSEFPLYLRIPDWVDEANILVNGRDLPGRFSGGRFASIRRVWRYGDQVRLIFPMKIRVRIWEGIGGAASVRRGPLWYSLKIGETWRRYGGTDEWPAYEIWPTTPWNYGLVLDPSRPEKTIKLSRSTNPPFQPFEPENAPLTLTARGRMVSNWKEEGRMVGAVPPSPVTSRAKTVKIELIPMGSARLRITAFPVVKT